MFPRRLAHPLLLGLLATSLLPGCGGDKPKLVPVTGKVTHKGQGVTAGSVILYPDAANSYQKDNPSSLLQVDGSFSFKTFPFGDGVPPGKYKAALAPELASRLKAPKYARAETSPWLVEVPDTGKKNLDLEVK